MITDNFPLSVLVLSPTPPIPRDYGNRNRVFQTLDFFRSQGFRISFLLYPFDDDWHQGVPPSYHDLVAEFDYFAAIPNSRKLHQNAIGHHHEIDEWWDDTIGLHLEWLMSRKRYDVLFVNYTFFSRAFEYMKNGTVGILDTHDIFSGRRELFEAAGVSPEFFYTTLDQEKIAFDRAHGIIAIKRSEAEWIRTVTETSVFNIPYWDTRPGSVRTRSGSLTFDHERPLRIGFIGAENSVNIVNMQRFLRVLSRFVEFYNAPIEVVVAGNVCKGLGDYPFLRKLGRVRLVSNFYEQVDATVAPLEFSTGIKIKVGEALAQHIPVIATQNAFDGFRAYHKTQSEPDLAALCDSLVSLAYGEMPLALLEAAASKAAVSGSRAHGQGFRKLHGWLKTRLRRVIILTDRCFWYRANLFDEACAQAVEYFGQVLPTIVCGTWPIPPDAKRIYAPLEFRDVEPTAEAIKQLLRDAGEKFEIPMVIVVSSSEDFVATVTRASQTTSLKLFKLELKTAGPTDVVRFEAVSGEEDALVVSPLRYIPIGAQPIDNSRHEVTIYVSDQAPEWGLLATRYLETIAEEKGFCIRRQSIPEYAEFSDEFLRSNLGSASERVIFVTGNGSSITGLSHLARLRGQALMILNENFLLPETSRSDTCLPSLTASIDEFFATDVGIFASHQDPGWSRVWERLS